MKKLTTNQIRQAWIDFFKNRNHYFVEPKSLIPVNDPSLLWINSGVATLKDYFSGKSNPPEKRLVNSQKAIRTNDITNVGVTSRHHTFFEMLGNFSIGDYFKEDAIAFAYDFLVKELEIDPSKLYITVYEEDYDTYDLWIRHNIDVTHIVKGNKERNFWDLGAGPCGPCTEIFYDRGSKYDPRNLGTELFKKDIENDRFVEIWNIVFSQFNNDGNGNYEELSRKNIDTGAGLERIACISQDVPTNFDTDAFIPIIKKIESFSIKPYKPDAYFKKDLVQKRINQGYRIIADHLKAFIFAVSDGAVPGPKDRGSILRKLIRRAIVCLRRLDINKNILDDLVDVIIDQYKEFYTQLPKTKERVLEVINHEYDLFNKTLDTGLKLFNESIENNKIDTKIVFKLVETYGFPLEIIKEIASERNIYIDEEKFNMLYHEHQMVSKGKDVDFKMNLQKNTLVEFKAISTFLYDQTKLPWSKVIGIFNKNFEPLKTTSEDCWLVFDETVFYATSGGQTHDEGTIYINENIYDLVDVIKGTNGQHFHLINNNKIISLGDEVKQEVDTFKRSLITKNHTTEHLIQYTLQTEISKLIKQEGAFKSSEKVTFDFNYQHKLTNDQLNQIEQSVNELIKRKIKVQTILMSLEEAKKYGAIGYFNDVYEKVKGKLRVVDIGGFSKELCGGTHVNNTSEIEQFLITKFTSKGNGSYRIEAITSDYTVNNFINSKIEAIKTKINAFINEFETYHIDYVKFREELTKIRYETSVENYKLINKQFEQIEKIHQELISEYQKTQAQTNKNFIIGKYLSDHHEKFVLEQFENIDFKLIIESLFEVANQKPEQLFIALTNENNKLRYVAVCHDSFVKKNELNASLIIKEFNLITSGSGGGRPNFSQGGSNNFDLKKPLIEYIKTINEK